MWFKAVGSGLTGKLPAKEKGDGRDRNPLDTLGAGGRNGTVDLLISNQMGSQHK